MSGYKYIKFIEIDVEKRKTRMFRVLSKSQDVLLGVVKWYSPWRQYCFFPDGDTVWDKNCLLDIIDFIDHLMNERKQKKNKKG